MHGLKRRPWAEMNVVVRETEDPCRWNEVSKVKSI